MRRLLVLVLGISFVLSACAGRQESVGSGTSSVLPDARVKSSVSAAAPSSVTYFNVGSDPNRDVFAFDIVLGADGNVYYGTMGPLVCNASGFCYATAGNVGKLDPSSAGFTELALSGPPEGLLFTPDGALWAGEIWAGKLARITPFATSGVQEIPVPNPSGTQLAGPRSLAYGPDGNVWFSLQSQAEMGKIPAAGPYDESSITTYAVPNGPAGTPGLPARPYGVVAGPDGNIWFADKLNGVVYKMTTGGMMTSYIPPIQKTLGSSNTSNPAYLSVGSDKKLYLTLLGPTGVQGYINQVATWGSFANVAISTGALPYLTRAGANIVAYGDLNNSAVGIYDVSTNSTREIPTAPAVNSGRTIPDGVAVAPDGSVWFACYGNVSGQPLCIGHLVLTSTWAVFPGTTITLQRGKTTRSQLIGIAESGNSGPFTVTSSNPNVVTVSTIPHQDHNFILNPVGYVRAFVYVRDAHGRTVKLTVTVERT